MDDDLSLHAEPLVETLSPVPGIMIADHFTESYGYRVNRSHGTKDWVMTFTLSGTGQYRIGEFKLLCQAGDVVILKPGTPHHYSTPQDETWDFVWSHFIPEPRWAGLLQLPEAVPGLIRLAIDSQSARSRLLQAFERLIRDTREEMPLKELMMINTMEEIVLIVAGQHSRSGERALDPRVEEVLQLLAGSMNESHTIEKLARRVALSPSRLAHLFKEQVGDSVMETLLKIRMRHAARLLAHTSRQVAEIADDVGFRSPYFFTKQFTAFYGCSPTAYRERQR